MCLPFGTTKAGAVGTEAGQVGAPEEGLSGFEARRCVLPRRSAVNDTSVTCPAACCERYGEGRTLLSLCE